MLKLVKAQGQGLVSDLGRWGYQSQGVAPGGVMDPLSFTVGNMALGNAPNSACLELMGKFDFVCTATCRVLLANSTAKANLNGRPVNSGLVLCLQEGDLLCTSAPMMGFWNILCIQGGVDVPVVMDSRSTCLAAGFGGFRGRALQAGDEIRPGPLVNPALPDGLRIGMPSAGVPGQPHLDLHVLPGPEFWAIDAQSRQVFSSQVFFLTQQSSRMGYRLDADSQPLQLTKPLSLRSHIVHPGIVQLPPSGQPVVLLSEAQVSGGYPRIASVLECDLWKFAHLSHGQGIRWHFVDAAQADHLQRQYEKNLRRYQHVIESERSPHNLDQCRPGRGLPE